MFDFLIMQHTGQNVASRRNTASESAICCVRHRSPVTAEKAGFRGANRRGPGCVCTAAALPDAAERKARFRHDVVSTRAAWPQTDTSAFASLAQDAGAVDICLYDVILACGKLGFWLLHLDVKPCTVTAPEQGHPWRGALACSGGTDGRKEPRVPRA